MNITDEAKVYIKQAMQENNIDTLRFYGIAGCCGVNLGLALQEAEEGDELTQINDVNIAIQPDIKNELATITLDVEGEGNEIGLVLHGYNPISC